MQQLTLDGVALDDPANRWYVLFAGSSIRQPPAIIVNDVTISGMHGVLRGGQNAYGPGVVAINFRLRSSTAGGLLTNYNALLAAVRTFNRSRVLIDRDGSSAYRAEVEYVSASNLSLLTPSKADTTVTFSIPRSFWRDENASEIDLGTTTGTKTPGALNGGSAPIVDPIIVATGSGTVSFRMADTETGTWLQWVGTIPAGQSLRIEPDTQAAWLVPSASPWTGGTSVSGLLSLSPGQFQLSASNNFQVTKNWTAQTLMRARRAYL